MIDTYLYFILGFVLILLLFYIFKNNNKNQNISNYPKEDLWNNIIEYEQGYLYTFILPDNFNINPKYIKYHPDFTYVDNDKTIYINSETEGKAVAMLYLWILLNKNLLDNENNFNLLFNKSIHKAKKFNFVLQKFKKEINNLLFEENIQNYDNMEFSQDLELIKDDDDEIIEIFKMH